MCLHLVAHSVLLAGNSAGEVHAWEARSGEYLWGASSSGAPLGGALCRKAGSGGGGGGGGGGAAAPAGHRDSRDAVRRVEALGDCVYMCMRSGRCLVAGLSHAALPRLREDWEAAVRGGSAGGGGGSSSSSNSSSSSSSGGGGGDAAVLHRSI
jgi:hypothetical protein